MELSSAGRSQKLEGHILKSFIANERKKIHTDPAQEFLYEDSKIS